MLSRPTFAQLNIVSTRWKLQETIILVVEILTRSTVRWHSCPPQVNRPQPVSLYAEEAKVNPGVLNICQVHPPALVHFQSQPNLVLTLHILLQQLDGVHDVQVIPITCVMKHNWGVRALL